MSLLRKTTAVSEYIMFALEHINYSMAAVGMAQRLDEAGLKPDRDWTALEGTSLPIETKRHVAEIVLCRHQIIHTRRCALERDTRGNFEKAERLFGVEPISEYRIYATKRPWTWYYDGLLPYLELARDPTEEEIPARSTST